MTNVDDTPLPVGAFNQLMNKILETEADRYRKLEERVKKLEKANGPDNL